MVLEHGLHLCRERMLQPSTVHRDLDKQGASLESGLIALNLGKVVLRM